MLVHVPLCVCVPCARPCVVVCVCVCVCVGQFPCPFLFLGYSHAHVRTSARTHARTQIQTHAEQEKAHKAAAGEQDALFREVRARIPLKLMPSSISNIGDAVRHELSKMLLKLDPLLGGVPLTITKLKIPETSVSIFEDQPHLHLDVTCDLLLFAPQIGHMVHGVVNNVAEDAVGLLILDTFNATIPHTQVSFLRSLLPRVGLLYSQLPAFDEYPCVCVYVYVCVCVCVCVYSQLPAFDEDRLHWVSFDTFAHILRHHPTQPAFPCLCLRFREVSLAPQVGKVGTGGKVGKVRK